MLKDFFGLKARSDNDCLECQDIIKCVFNLKDTDLEVLKILQEGELQSARDLGEAIGRDRSTAHRSLERLATAGLCFKEKKTDMPRGYSYVYRSLTKKDIANKAEERLDECYSSLKEILRKHN